MKNSTNSNLNGKAKSFSKPNTFGKDNFKDTDTSWVDGSIEFLKSSFPAFKDYEDKAKFIADLTVTSMKKRPLYTALGAIGVGIFIGMALAPKLKIKD